MSPAPHSVSRVRAKAVMLGASIGVWLWCIIDLFSLLPRVLTGWGGMVVMMVVGGALYASRLRVLAVAALGGWTALVVLASLTPISRVVSDHWIRNDLPIVGPIGAVVVLSGGTTPDTTIDDEALDRLVAGIELAREHPPAVLVTTLGETDTPVGMITSEVDQARIVGVLSGGVEWLQTAMVHTTHDEALRSVELLRDRQIHRIVVLTSPMHTRRACATFEAVGFDVVCVPARLRGTSAFSLPGPRDRIVALGAWIYEVLGTLEYRARGWIPG